MIIKNKKELKKYKEVCDLSIEILGKIKEFVQIGYTTLEIDKYAQELCEKYSVRPAFKGVKVGNAPEYEFTTCISLNDTVVHGIPNDEIIQKGDIVKVDFGIIKNGYYTDHCFTLGMEPLSEEDRKFITESRNAVVAGVHKAFLDNTIGDIGGAIESHAKKHSLSVVKEFVGHGIGKSLHDPPDIPCYKGPGASHELQKGLVICIEAQIVEGKPDVYTCSDKWTIKTKDKKRACMFEYIVMVDKKKPKILTNTIDWDLFK